MEEGFDLVPWLKIAPLLILLVVATVGVIRGMRTRPDDTNNKARGGGVDPHQGL